MEQSSITKSSRSIVEKKFKQFQFLATEYANRVFNYERYGYEYDDIVQEMNIKIYMSILGWARRREEYRITGYRKPAPMLYWIKFALHNKVLDFTKIFNSKRIANKDKMSIEPETLDVGEWKTSSIEMDEATKSMVLNGVDVMGGLRGKRRECYFMFLQGYNQTELEKMFPEVSVSTLINAQNKFLTSKKDELLDVKNQRYEAYLFDD